MKKYLILISIVLIISCKQNRSKTKSTQLDDASIKKSVNIELALKNQYKDYLDAMLRGDIDKTFDYTHKIGIEQLKIKYQENNIVLIKNKLKKAYIKNGVAEINRMFNMKFIAGEILDSVKYQNEFIYILSYTKEGVNKLDKINLKSATIALSLEEGKTWRFFDLDLANKGKYKQLLKKYYPEKVINQTFDNITNDEEKKTNEKPLSSLDKTELNLFNQFNEYSKAMFNGNSNKVMNYLYPGFLEYLRRENTGEYSLEEIKQVFKEHIETASKKNRNTTIRVKINKITKKIQFKKELLYVLNYSLISEKINENISLGGEAIAISSDNGYKWSFLKITKKIQNQY